MELKPEDITEDWVRANIDIESKRKKIVAHQYQVELIELLSYSDKEISLDEFLERINKKVNEIKEIYYMESSNVIVSISRDYLYGDDDSLNLRIVEYIDESDASLIKRLINQKKSSIRRAIKKKATDEKKKARELAEYKRLKAIYGKDK